MATILGPKPGNRVAIAPNSSVRRPDSFGSGQAVEIVKGLVSDQLKDATESEYAKAKAAFQVYKIEQEQKFARDPEIESVPDRFTASLQEGTAKAASMISDPELRDRFLTEVQPSVAEGVARIGEITFKRKADVEIATANETTKIMIDNAISGGDIIYSMDAIETLHNDLASRGVITHQAAQRSIVETKVAIATGRLKTMSPESQLEALKEPWVKELPLDVRTELKRSAEEKLLDDQARRQAASLDDYDLEEALQKLDSITDTKLYDRARQRLLQRRNDFEVVRQEKQKRLYEEIFPNIYFGNFTLDDLTIEEQQTLTPAQLSNLQAAEKRAIKKAAGEYVPEFSDPATAAKLREFIAKGSLVQAKKFFSENFSKLNDRDFKFYQVRIDPVRSKDPKFKGFQTARQLAENLMKSNGITDVGDKQRVYDSIQEFTESYYDEHGKNPDPRTLRERVLDEFTVIRRDPDAWIFDDDVYVKDMPDDERQQFFDAVELMRKVNPRISRDEIILRYENMLRNRNASQ